MALQVSGGRWSLSSFLPRKGTVHGVMRAPKSRWPAAMDQSDHSTNGRMFELCYTITPLDGDWGVLTRCMLVSSRFLLRNDSDLVTFEVKQTGNADATATTVLPGQTVPFHWGDFRLPELVSVRPDGKQNGMSIYRWSGGFDPLTIGHIPIRVRKTVKIREESFLAENVNIHAIKMEVEIRPRTGGTGLTISFREEDPTGSDSLYRIDNLSPFPIWFCQEDVLGNSAEKNADAGQGEILCPYGSIAFALDVPFKRGKYTNRKAASLAVLLRARIALAPLSTRPGIETAKVVSLANAGAGAIVRLNPSKLAFLDGTTRRVLQKVRVLGVVHNDGPTRVLTLR